MTDANDWNRRNIEEFRANGGKVGGNFEGTPMLLLEYEELAGGRQIPVVLLEKA